MPPLDPSNSPRRRFIELIIKSLFYGDGPTRRRLHQDANRVQQNREVRAFLRSDLGQRLVGQRTVLQPISAMANTQCFPAPVANPATIYAQCVPIDVSTQFRVRKKCDRLGYVVR